MIETSKTVTAAELATFDLFKDDSPEALEWLAERFEVRSYQTGEHFIKNGDPAAELMVILEGEMHFAREGIPYGNVFVRVPGQPTGLLPYSRMTTYKGSAWAVKPTRAIVLHVSHFRELVHKAPALTEKLVNEMIDRSRDFTQRNERANKMLALGKLSAGLAHELNNPASAVLRSAARLRDVLIERRVHALAMKHEVVPVEAQALLTDLGEMIAEAARNPKPVDALERADLEAEMSDWLEAHHMATSSASAIVETGIPISQVEPLLGWIGPNNFEHGMHMLAADFEILGLSREIEDASRRISDLVQAVKAYSYMDRVPVTEVNVEQGIEVTLRMFQHQLKHGYEVKRVFAENLPKICANGSELNQIWTNLIDNAIDAMSASPVKVLEIRTCTEPGGIMVDVIDSGAGIPKDVQSRIFDPFFTTKDVGKGTGLGLDIVARIVRSHNGAIQVHSVPGRTVFQVRLPLGYPEA